MRDPSTARVKRYIRPGRRHAGWLGCVAHIHSEMGRLGLQSSDFNHYQSHALFAIEDGLDESAVAEMFEWWHYDLEALQKRGSHMGPAKPRIDLWMHFNQRGNFSLLWEPANTMLGRPGPECDWKQWCVVGGYAGGRPSNEILWIRDLHDAAHIFRRNTQPRSEDELPEFFLQRPGWEERAKKERRDYLREDRNLDGLLLQGVAALVDLLKSRLRPHFEMNWITDIFMEWEQLKDETASLGTRDRLTSWTIEDVLQRNQRLEREELKAMPKAAGCTQAQLIDAYREVSAPTKRGPPVEEWKPDRMSKLLKKRGHPQAMPKIIRLWVTLLRKYNPELFPKPQVPKPPLSSSTENVVPFKR